MLEPFLAESPLTFLSRDVLSELSTIRDLRTKHEPPMKWKPTLSVEASASRTPNISPPNMTNESNIGGQADWMSSTNAPLGDYSTEPIPMNWTSSELPQTAPSYSPVLPPQDSAPNPWEIQQHIQQVFPELPGAFGFGIDPNPNIAWEATSGVSGANVNPDLSQITLSNTNSFVPLPPQGLQSPLVNMPTNMNVDQMTMPVWDAVPPQ